MGIDAVLQRGRALVAQKVGGEPMSVFRPSPLVPPSGILDSAPVLTNVVAKLERTTSRDWLENELFEIVTENAKVSNTNLVLGDILQKMTDGSVYCYAQTLPTTPTIFVRCEYLALIKRPYDATAVTPPPPVNGVGNWSESIGTTEVNEATAKPLTQLDGNFTFEPVDFNNVPTVMPFALQPTSRARPGRPGMTESTATPIERFVGYLPPTLGARLRENDEIELQDGSGFVFVVEQVFSTTIGLLGTIMLLSKQGA